MAPKTIELSTRASWLSEESIRRASEAMHRTLEEKLLRPLRPPKYVLILDWKGWRLVQELSERPALGTDFISPLPNGKRGLFGYGEEFISTKGLPGWIYYCKEEL
jgi:hypothetical protein